MRSVRSALLWTVGLTYAIVIFFLLYLVTFFAKPETYHNWLRRRARRLFQLLRCPLVCSGPVPELADGPFIFMANHSSLLDVPLMEAVVPMYFKGILSDHQFSWPLYGAVLKRTGQLAIPRQNVKGSQKIYSQAIDVLNQGTSIAVLPEGNRTLDGKLRRFRTMPFLFALEAGVPIIPIGLEGPFDIKNKGSWHLNPRTIYVRFGVPITLEDMKDMDIRQLKKSVRQSIKVLCGETADSGRRN